MWVKTCCHTLRDLTVILTISCFDGNYMLNRNSINHNGMSKMKSSVKDTKFAWDYWYDSQYFKSKGLLV
jgi:hypothetical protein